MSNIYHICIGLPQGGIESILYKVILFTKKNINHTVISFRGKGYYGKKLEDIGVNVIYLDNNSGKFSFFSIIKLFKILKKNKPKIVQTWWYPADVIGGVIAHIAGIKNIVWGIFSTNINPLFVGPGTIFFLPFCILFSYFIPDKIISCTKKGIIRHSKIG